MGACRELRTIPFVAATGTVDASTDAPEQLARPVREASAQTDESGRIYQDLVRQQLQAETQRRLAEDRLEESLAERRALQQELESLQAQLDERTVELGRSREEVAKLRSASASSPGGQQERLVAGLREEVDLLRSELEDKARLLEAATRRGQQLDSSSFLQEYLFEDGQQQQQLAARLAEVELQAQELQNRLVASEAEAERLRSTPTEPSPVLDQVLAALRELRASNEALAGFREALEMELGVVAQEVGLALQASNADLAP